MHFHKYSEIDNLTPAWIQAVRECGFDKECAEWVCAVKMDGANFQIAIDENNDIHYGSRNQELGRYDNFNGYQHVVARDQLDEKARKLKQLWVESQHGTESGLVLVGANIYPVTICIYGEFIGGCYRHKDVAPDQGATKLQGRVNYCPDNRWVPFDIFVYIHTPTGCGYYLSPDDVAFFCNNAGLYSQMIAFRGTFDEAISYPNDFQDEIGHLMFGLPKLEENVVEGTVIKPARELRFPNGERVIIKNKNRIFLERGHKTNRQKKPAEPMNELEESMYDNMADFLNESRLYSVLSKMDLTNLQQQDFGKLVKAVFEDLNKDFLKEFGGQVQVLEGEHPVTEFNMHKVFKQINKDICELVRPVFLDKLRENKNKDLTNEETT